MAYANVNTSESGVYVDLSLDVPADAEVDLYEVLETLQGVVHGALLAVGFPASLVGDVFDGE